MPAAIQMMAALALFMVAVVTLLVSIVIGAIFARVVYSATRWVFKVLNEPGADEIADAADSFPAADTFATDKARRIPA